VTVEVSAMTSISLPVAEDMSDLFGQRLAQDGQSLSRRSIRTLQLNVGKMCNLACHHCHVEAGPKRTEIMTWDVMRKILDWLDAHRAMLGVQVVDLTGGAPEMNPQFRRLVDELVARDLHVLDRCNLTILLESGYEDLIGFLAGRNVEIVASLPCYLEDNVDQQRGKGVYHDSIEALLRLNKAGYGMPGSTLKLDLVYNPSATACRRTRPRWRRTTSASCEVASGSSSTRCGRSRTCRSSASSTRCIAMGSTTRTWPSSSAPTARRTSKA